MRAGQQCQSLPDAPSSAHNFLDRILSNLLVHEVSYARAATIINDKEDCCFPLIV